ncbi:MAG TPA: hypothetical protein VIM75_15005 [Ohtaekwangia sp.]|uniref:hypothetical protein n=1 Tax=Ohtaekwangia sp. TaxID=2066019 RepID=UPI002F94662C
MIYTAKRLQKLQEKLQALSTQLQCERSVGLHQAINQFYYLQKIEEIKYLLDKLRGMEEQRIHLAAIIETEYIQIFTQWRKDVRVLINYQRDKRRNHSIL